MFKYPVPRSEYEWNVMRRWTDKLWLELPRGPHQVWKILLRVWSDYRRCLGWKIDLLKPYRSVTTDSYNRSTNSHTSQFTRATVSNLGYANTSYGVRKKKKKKNIYIYIYRDKYWIMRARFRVSHRTPGRKDIRFWSAISLSLSLSLLCESYLGG
jgi:hypothetical protein